MNSKDTKNKQTFNNKSTEILDPLEGRRRIFFRFCLDNDRMIIILIYWLKFGSR